MAHNSESVGTWVCGLRKAYRQAVPIFRHRVYPIDFENALRFQAGPLTETSLPFHGCRMYAYAPERASAFSPFIFGHLLLRVNRFRSSRRSKPLPACADEGVYPEVWPRSRWSKLPNGKEKDVWSFKLLFCGAVVGLFQKHARYVLWS